MTFLDKFSLDREKRRKAQLDELARLERIAQLERDIKASKERLANGTPAPPISQPQAPTSAQGHNFECHRRYNKYGINHYPTDGCPCHKHTGV